MGKKKKKNEQKPWCYYCDRVFDDEAMLVQHQRAKHFKCPDCPKKLNTAQVVSPCSLVRWRWARSRPRRPFWDRLSAATPDFDDSASQGLWTHANQVHKNTITA